MRHDSMSRCRIAPIVAALLSLINLKAVVVVVHATTNFCGTNWGDASTDCANRQPCPLGTDEECQSQAGTICWADTNCDTSTGGGLLYDLTDPTHMRFCGSTWSDANDNCSPKRHCPSGDKSECKGQDEECYSYLSDCNYLEMIGGPGSSEAASIIGGGSGGGGGGEGGSNNGGPPRLPTNDPSRGNYCGMDWNDVIAHCSDDTRWCKSGADSDCPEEGQICFATGMECKYEADLFPTTTPTDRPSDPPTPSPTEYNTVENSRFCGEGWEDATNTCRIQSHCPSGSNAECRGVGQVCFSWITGCNIIDFQTHYRETGMEIMGAAHWLLPSGMGLEADIGMEPTPKPVPQLPPAEIFPGMPMQQPRPGSPSIAKPPWVQNIPSPTRQPTRPPSKFPTSFPLTEGPTRRPTDPPASFIFWVDPPTRAPSSLSPSKFPTPRPWSTEPPTRRPLMIPTPQLQSPPRSNAPTRPPTPMPTEWPTPRATNPPTRQPSSRPPTKFPTSLPISTQRPTPMPTPPTATTTTTSNNTNTNQQCSSRLDCQTGQFCNRGYCGECRLSNGLGCTVEEVCRTTVGGCYSGSQEEPPPGVAAIAKCHRRWVLNRDCQVRLNDNDAQCNVDEMVCERGPSSGSDASVALYQNPQGNDFFCGLMFSQITKQCLQSKPCPGGFASRFCADNEGCFFAPSCATQYWESGAIATASNLVPPPPTPPPTPNPSKQPSNPPTRDPTPKPSKQPTNPPTRNPTLDPTAQLSYRDPMMSASKNDPTGSITNKQSPFLSKPSTTSPPTSNTFQQPQLASQTTPQSQPLPSESCSLCGDSELDSSQRADLLGNDLSCGEFDDVFVSEKILEGSDQCLNFRSQYFDKCCFAKSSGDVCDLCGAEIEGLRHVVRNDVNVEFFGDQVSCADLSKKANTIEVSNGQCVDMKNEHFYECCVEKCSLCGESSLDWEAVIFFSGEEVRCHEFDSKILAEQGISSDSTKCETSQKIYSATCCIQSPEKPCNLCNSNHGTQFNINHNARVSYDGQVKTCLEVHNSLQSRREQSSDHCIDAQGKLFDQCCEAIITAANPVDSSSGVQSSPTTSPAAQKPSRGFVNWQQRGPLASPATTNLVSIWSFCFLIAVGPIVIINL
mmetsp:Transcript_23553/g.50865  ORF Transcript_23553/g.50865 Transcript_23553/m.50865 type:complete len:1125 (+) Transcript_23553:119-3493(+)